MKEGERRLKIVFRCHEFGLGAFGLARSHGVGRGLQPHLHLVIVLPLRWYIRQLVRHKSMLQDIRGITIGFERLPWFSKE